MNKTIQAKHIDLAKVGMTQCLDSGGIAEVVD